MLRGKAAVCIWNKVEHDFDEEFRAWHTNEHMPERMALPGFLRGRRYCSEQTEYFTLYEVADSAALTSDAYRERLNHPTDSTLNVLRHFKYTIRVSTDIDYTTGVGNNSAIGTLTFDDRLDPQRLRRLAAEAISLPGIVGCHLCLKQETTSLTQTESWKRSANLPAPSAALLIEGTFESLSLQIDNIARLIGKDSVSALGVYRHQATCDAAEFKNNADRS